MPASTEPVVQNTKLHVYSTMHSSNVKDQEIRNEHDDLCNTIRPRNPLRGLTSVPNINERICLKRTIGTNLSDTSVDGGRIFAGKQ